MGMLASNLFIRTWIKGEQAYIAMESRCYDGTIRLLKNKESIRQVRIRNLLLLGLFESFLLIGVYLTGNFRIF
jgi:cobalt/nickel transport system permease protein